MPPHVIHSISLPLFIYIFFGGNLSLYINMMQHIWQITLLERIKVVMKKMKLS